MHYFAAIAKHTTERYVKKQALPLPHLTPELTRQQACYVYLFENPGRKLRAAHGSPLPRYANLAAEIVSNTLSALDNLGPSTIRRAELPALIYLVAVLGPLQRISHESQLDPKMYGLWLCSDQGKKALILPQRTGIDTAADQVATALREAAIRRRETYVMYRFSATYYD